MTHLVHNELVGEGADIELCGVALVSKSDIPFLLNQLAQNEELALQLVALLTSVGLQKDLQASSQLVLQS